MDSVAALGTRFSCDVVIANVAQAKDAHTAESRVTPLWVPFSVASPCFGLLCYPVRLVTLVWNSPRACRSFDKC